MLPQHLHNLDLHIPDVCTSCLSQSLFVPNLFVLYYIHTMNSPWPELHTAQMYYDSPVPNIPCLGFTKLVFSTSHPYYPNARPTSFMLVRQRLPAIQSQLRQVSLVSAVLVWTTQYWIIIIITQCFRRIKDLSTSSQRVCLFTWASPSQTYLRPWKWRKQAEKQLVDATAPEKHIIKTASLEKRVEKVPMG